MKEVQVTLLEIAALCAQAMAVIAEIVSGMFMVCIGLLQIGVALVMLVLAGGPVVGMVLLWLFVMAVLSG